MDADTVQALRDAKALFDEGILSEQEFKEKKAELLQPKAAPVTTKPKPKPKPAPKKKSEAKPKAEKKPKKSTASSDGSEKEKKAPRVAGAHAPGRGRGRRLGDGQRHVPREIFAGVARRELVQETEGLGFWGWHRARDGRGAQGVDGAGHCSDGGGGRRRRGEAARVVAGVGGRGEAEALRGGGRHSWLHRVRRHARGFCKHKRAVLVKGDTKNVKPVLQALEGSWNKGLGGWVFPMKKREEVFAALRQDPTNTINEDPALVAEAAKAVKAEPVAEKRKSVDAADAPEAKRQSRRRAARARRSGDSVSVPFPEDGWHWLNEPYSPLGVPDCAMVAASSRIKPSPALHQAGNDATCRPFRRAPRGRGRGANARLRRERAEHDQMTRI